MLTRTQREFLAMLDLLAPTTDLTVSIATLTAHLGWTYRATVSVAWELIEARVVNTDAGLGQDPTEVYGRGRR